MTRKRSYFPRRWLLFMTWSTKTSLNSKPCVVSLLPWCSSTCILEQHLKQISKASRIPGSGRRSSLVEANVNKNVAGKKGAKSKYPYRPPRSETPEHAQAQERSNNGSGRYLYNEIHHNDNPFVLRILPKDAKSCRQCKTDFCHRVGVIPNDLVFEHQERYYFPLNGDWKQKQASAREVIRYYHTDLACMRARFPYFCKEYIAIPPDVLAVLHKSYLVTHFGLQLWQWFLVKHSFTNIFKNFLSNWGSALFCSCFRFVRFQFYLW